VLLEDWKPRAINQRWIWVGADLSETASMNEANLVTRILTDLSVATSSISITRAVQPVGFELQRQESGSVNYQFLVNMYAQTPGLPSDKLKHVLEFVWKCFQPHGFKGIVFAYDEAQTMADHPKKEQFPLSLLLEVFQSIQRKGIPFLLVLVGLPTLFPKLVDTRTYSERMFEVITLVKLTEGESREAITEPIKGCPLVFTEKAITLVIQTSGGYPYFIQFICREVYDIYIQKIAEGNNLPSVQMDEITRKLDKDFFAGRWAKASDRQRELLGVIALLDNNEGEFTVQEIVAQAKSLASPFSSSQVSQMLVTLTTSGLIYKNRHGKYSFAVPLLGRFILRQARDTELPLF
jgi:hypothetical protein